MIEAYFNGTYVAPINYVNYKESEHIKETFISRQTANGQNILDPSPAVVEMIKGKTVKSTNLIPFPYSSKSGTFGGGVEVTVNDDGSITFNGTATAQFRFDLYYKIYVPLTEGKITYSVSTTGLYTGIAYLQSAQYKDESYTNWGNGLPLNSNDSVTHSYTINLLCIFVKTDCTFDNLTVYPMLNEGDTAKPFVPYFSGLKHANFKAIKSTGKNVLKVKDYTKTYGGVTVSVKDNKFTATGTATGAIELWLPLETTLQAGTYSSIIGTEQRLFGTGVQRMYLSPKYRDYDNRKSIAKIDYPVQNATVNFVSNYMAIYIAKGNEVNCSLDLMLNIGSTAQPFEPYKVEEYGDGNTYELAEYDYINPQKGEIIRQTGYATSETGFTAEELANYNEPIVSADNRSLVYKLATPTIETLDYPKEYTAYNGGSETVDQGETDNSQWGAICEITIQYFMPSEENILMLYDIFVKEE